MGDLIVLNVNGSFTDDDVVARLSVLQQDYLIDLRNTCVAERDEWGRVCLTPAIIWWSRVEDDAECAEETRYLTTV